MLFQAERTKATWWCWRSLKLLLASSPLPASEHPSITLLVVPRGPVSILDAFGHGRHKGLVNPSFASPIGLYVVSVIKQGEQCFTVGAEQNCGQAVADIIERAATLTLLITIARQVR
ncbi:hypothetical protein QCA50_010239 [Cerrena zonata]|uniref:Uncharacterized protein n=1 Tax=Cerrena zonata TaxID=2478898 RepID=A0AAW0G4M7_9APHY